MLAMERKKHGDSSNELEKQLASPMRIVISSLSEQILETMGVLTKGSNFFKCLLSTGTIWLPILYIWIDLS